MFYNFKTYAFVNLNQILGLIYWCVNIETCTVNWFYLTENTVFLHKYSLFEQVDRYK